MLQVTKSQDSEYTGWAWQGPSSLKTIAAQIFLLSHVNFTLDILAIWYGNFLIHHYTRRLSHITNKVSHACRVNLWKILTLWLVLNNIIFCMIKWKLDSTTKTYIIIHFLKLHMPFILISHGKIPLLCENWAIFHANVHLSSHIWLEDTFHHYWPFCLTFMIHETNQCNVNLVIYLIDCQTKVHMNICAKSLNNTFNDMMNVVQKYFKKRMLLTFDVGVYFPEWKLH